MGSSQRHISEYEAEGQLLSWIKPYVRESGNAVRSKWKMEDRKLLDYLLVYIEKGGGIFRIDGVEYKAEEKDLFWIPPDTIHYMEGTTASMVCPYVHFDLVYRYPESHWQFTIPGGTVDLTDYSSLMHPPVPDSPLSALKGKCLFSNSEYIGSLINRISSIIGDSRPYSGIVGSGVMLELLTEIVRGIGGMTKYSPSHAAILEKASLFMRNNLQKSLLIEKIAWQAGFSESHFRKLFRKFYGISPGSFLQHIRISQAKELMVYSSRSQTEIAGLCGYETVHSFSKAFKKHEGISPRQYRNYGIAEIETQQASG